MNLKLFFLIHSERPYAHYYYQGLEKKFLGASFVHEFKLYLYIFLRSIYLPFNKKYNKQLYAGIRKSKIEMLFEVLVWAFKYKEVCSYYFLYGLDLKGHSPKNYVGYTEFRVLRNILNFRYRENLRTLYTFNYLVLARDKFLFYQYCKSLNMPYPQTIALLSKGKISWFNGSDIEYQSIASIKQHTFDAFCKEVNGESGRGAFPLKSKDGKLYLHDKEVDIEEIKLKVGSATFIIQERLENHSLIDKIYPDSLNTLKLVTFLKDDGEVVFFDSVMRFGAGGNFVDNASSGGIFVGVDEEGYLHDVGFREPGISENLVIRGIHPDTKVKFGGIRLPFWNEMLNTVKRFHRFFYGIPSIGWDIAFTPQGFVFTETGEDWEIPVYQVTNGGKRKQYYQLHGKALEMKLRKSL